MPAFLCPHCRCKLTVSDSHSGKALLCPACRKKLVYPAARQTISPLPALPTGTGATVSLAADSAATASYRPAAPGSLETTPPLDAAPGTTAESGSPDPASQSEPVPGYAIEKELGRGGMGVVYLARHLRLKRRVALKMILAGGHAGEWELARFRTEAEAVARLQHPGIVQIHEIGEHRGLPYFALEYCPGGSLHHKLGGAPLAPGEAAALVEKLAHAMQAAHDKGVIHRDLKPANILLAEDGTPRITDFGLARKIDEAGQTATGTVMGTPSYMAPEQAQGEVKDLGPACDTYALGAILYECLTGRPPFRGPTMMDTLRQVLSDEPVPPTQLQSQVPRDLETICLKCLSKEPARRYGTARELAEDLGRFQRGEPIAARPVGRVERGVKWVRRNPVVAGLAAAVAAAVAAGVTVSLLFGLAAAEEAQTARKKEADAIEARNDAVQARDDLARANDRLEATLARSLLAPLGLQDEVPEMALFLAEPEWKSLWELAKSRPGHLGYRFVEEASRDPVTSRQLRRRGALALSAAVGLDERRRAEVEELLLTRLDGSDLSDEQKTDLALALTAWDGLSRRGAGRTAHALIRMWKGPRDSVASIRIVRGLSEVCSRVEGNEAGKAARELLEAILALRNCDSFDYAGPVGSLQELCARLEGQEAGQTAPALLQAILALKDNEKASVQAFLIPALADAAARLEGEEASGVCAQVAAVLSRVMKDSKGSGDRDKQWAMMARAQRLAALAARMEEKDAAALCAPAIDSLHPRFVIWTSSSIDPGGLIRGQWWMNLSKLATAPKGKAASPLCRAVALELIGVLLGNLPHGEDETLLQHLLPVCARLEPGDAAQVAAVLLKALTDTSRIIGSNPALVKVLAAVSARLDPQEANRTVGKLVAALEANIPPRIPVWPMRSLAVVSARLEGKELADLACTLIGTVKHNPEFFFGGEMGQLLLVTCARLEGEGAAQAAAALLEGMKATRDQDALAGLAKALAALLPRLEARKASALCAPVVTPLLRNTRENPAFGPALAAVCAGLDDTEAARAAADLVQIIKEIKDSKKSFRFIQALSAACSRVEGEGAARTTVALAGLIVESDPSTWQFPEPPLLAPLLTASARLGPKDAAALTPAAANLVRLVQDNQNPVARRQLGKCLAAVSTHLAEKDRSAICGPAARALARAIPAGENAVATCELARGLSEVSSRLERKQASAICSPAAVALVGAIRGGRDLGYSLLQVEALSLVCARLEEEEVVRIASDIVSAMKETKDLKRFTTLGTALTQVTARLGAPSPVCAPAAHALARAITGNQNASEAQTLAWPLAGLSVRLDSKDAARTAAVLAEAIKEGRNSISADALATALSALCARMEAKGLAPIATVLVGAIRDSKDRGKLLRWGEALSAAAAGLEGEEARKAAATLVKVIGDHKVCGELLSPLLAVAERLEEGEAAIVCAQVAAAALPLPVNASVGEDPLRDLHALLCRVPRARIVAGLPGAIFTLASPPGAGHPLTTLAILWPAVEPPCRLTTQQLVELLKMPSCAGKARRLVLDQLGNRYGRPFADAWELVHFAEQDQLDLDFTSPPQRPGSAEPIGRP